MRPACPNVITLNQYVSGALDESRADDIAEHLKQNQQEIAKVMSEYY